jgi:hypothetical protein
MSQSFNRRNFLRNSFLTAAGLMTTRVASYSRLPFHLLENHQKSATTGDGQNYAALIKSANIKLEQWPSNMREHLNLYMGNGRFGSGFDVYGLMNNGYQSDTNESISNTMLMHADHWSRGEWGMDSYLTVGRVVWPEKPSAPPTKYNQELDIRDGILYTNMIWENFNLKVKTYYHAKFKDLLIYDIRYESNQNGDAFQWAFVPERNPQSGHYKEQFHGNFETIDCSSPSFYLGRLTVGTAQSAYALKLLSTQGKASLASTTNCVGISFSGPKGHHLLVIGVAGWMRREEMLNDLKWASSTDNRLEEESKQAMHQRWGQSYIQIPDVHLQKLWLRNHYYLLASYAPEVRSPAPPTGWTNNAWPRHFPQDMTCIASALLQLGHVDVVRSVVEFYRSNLEAMKSFTSEVFHAKGVMWAWEFPIGADSKMMRNGTPNWPQYEIHNAAYPAYMAREVSKYLNNPAWAKDVAWPVVYESALFYASALKKGPEGLWNLQVIPSMGQDESGPRNAKNYLCALYAARYTISTALTMAAEIGVSNPAFQQWKKIMREGLAFQKLYEASRGIYATCQTENGLQSFGIEKHPIQLNPLIYLPGGTLNEAERKAYELRYDLCERAHEHYFKGWTVPAYLISSARIGNAEGLLRDLQELKAGNMVDDAWIQLFEGTQRHDRAYYTTNGGWYLSSLCESMITNFWGKPQIGNACPPAWQEVRFHNLYINDGQRWSGRRVNGKWQVKAESYR